ncbi:MAG: outer membrane protein assembly factor BamA [Verrucomicrobia bacterium]|nr:MAG: outer membrane protein assembly factor BamA [Verrucomicrobiota bacterium]PYL89504.1 MAG: outer membrane protein assembly factor BamA [Verrucomicrobiota bacterium]
MFYNSLRRLWGWGRISVSVFFAATIALIARAQSPPDAAHQGAPIVRSIDVQYTGPATISRARVLAQIRTKIGLPYSDTVAEDDIRTLYNTGQFQNVRIFGQPEGDGVKVIVAVQTRAMLNEIQIDGATRISPKKLRKNLGVKLNTPLREEDLEKGRQKIVETYQAHGFNDVEVTVHIEPIDATRGTSRAVYTVNEGIKGSITSVRFEGNAHFSDRVLRKQMKTRQKTIFAFVDKSGRLDETQLQDDLQKIREFYQNHGYVDVAVRDVRKERTSGGALQIVIVVDEGPLYHVGKISFVGYKATNEQKLRALLKMKEGDVYSAKAIKDDAKAMADAYGSGGYVDLTVIPESSPAHGGLIDLTYRIEEGQRSYVERINIIGNTRTKDKVIRREVLIAPGDVFNTVRVETSKKRLENLGYFSKVETFPVDTGVEGRKNLDIQVEEKRTGSLNFGAGFSTVDSLIGFIELTQVNFDITNWPSLTGGGQKFRIRLQGGLQRKDAEVVLTEPWFMDRPIAVSFSGFYHEANYLSSLYDQRNYGFSLDVRKGILPYLYATLGYRLENIDAFNIAASASPQLVAETGSSTKSVVTASLVFDRRDNPFLTRRGERITYTWWVAGPGGTEQIYGFDVEASKYWHLPWDTILLVNAEVAGVDSWGDQTKLVKIYDRLFLGGSNNLRGFEFRDVGPKDEDGEPLGGQSMARVTVEYTFPIIEKARGAIFYDTGFVNTNPWDYNFNNVASDIGFGLRLDLPIGPLRLDYGIPIQQAGNHGSGKFNFNVGYQF